MPDKPSAEVSKVDLANAIQIASQTGKIAIGVLECIVSVCRGKSRLVIIAEDIEPKHIVNELVNLCEKKRVPLLTSLSRREMGRCAQIDCGAAAVSIENPGRDPSFFQIALRQVGIRPETFHEVVLASHAMFEGETTSGLLANINLSLEDLGPIVNSPTITSYMREDASKRLAVILACSLSLAVRLELDPLQYIDFKY